MAKVKMTIEVDEEQHDFLVQKGKETGRGPEHVVELYLAIEIAGLKFEEKRAPIVAPKSFKDVRVGTVFGPDSPSPPFIDQGQIKKLIKNKDKSSLP
ncbi:hypothetical protein HQ571_00070 [Candidatus Kuenenbacteria bacterium]|nr:hypothetical protein [Candidatus Kuenenbacteria bacterium]